MEVHFIDAGQSDAALVKVDVKGVTALICKITKCGGSYKFLENRVNPVPQCG